MAQTIDNNWTTQNKYSDGLGRTNAHANQNTPQGIRVVATERLEDFPLIPMYSYTVSGGGTQLAFTAEHGFANGTLEFFKWTVTDGDGLSVYGAAVIATPGNVVNVDTSTLNRSSLGHNWTITCDVGLKNVDGTINRSTFRVLQPVDELAGNGTENIRFNVGITGENQDYDTGAITENLLGLKFAGNVLDPMANAPYDPTVAGQGALLALDLVKTQGKDAFVVQTGTTSIQVIFRGTEVFNGVQLANDFVTPTIIPADTADAQTYANVTDWDAGTNTISEMYADGVLVPLANYPYDPTADAAQLQTDLRAVYGGIWSAATAVYGAPNLTLGSGADITERWQLLVSTDGSQVSIFTRS